METRRDLARIKLRGLEDPYYFIKHILGYELLVKHVHKPLVDFVVNNKEDLLILIPRDHFKTTLLTVGLSIWRIVKNPNIKILLDHKVLGKSKEMLSEIKSQFEKNQRLRELFGNYSTGETWSTWGQRAITVSKRTSFSKEPTISTGAIGHEITSGHYNLTFNDDIVGLQDRYSQVARENTLRFLKSLQYVKDRADCQEITIGTRWHEDDAYNYIIQNRPKTKTYIRSAELPGNIPYFKERFTWENLKELEKDDPILYSSQMLNNPRPLETQLYNLDKLKFFDYDSIKKRYNIAYVDPAFGRKEKGEPCFFCLIIGTIIKDKLYIVEWLCNKKQPEENDLLIINKAKEYGFRRFGFESNSGQSIWGKNLQKLIRKAGIFLKIEFNVATQNKDKRIEWMHPLVINNVLFAEDWAERYKEAMSQLLLYPQHKYKDAPDCLEGLTGMVLKRKKLMVSFT